MILQYFMLALILLCVGFIMAFIFYKILHIRVFGGIILMTIVGTIGSLLGMHYFPIINELTYGQVHFSDTIAGAAIFIIILYIVTPKSLK